MKKHSSLGLLDLILCSASRWEAWLLLLLVVTVFGIALTQPSNFASGHVRTRSEGIEDPYDIRTERVENGIRNGIETGL
jgi:hypothetical protein